MVNLTLSPMNGQMVCLQNGFELQQLIQLLIANGSSLMAQLMQ